MGMKKESKKKSRKEKKEEESAMAVDDDDGAVANDAIVEEEEEEKPKKKKKSKKEKSSKKRSRDVDDSKDEGSNDNAAPSTTDDKTTKLSKEERRAARAAKKSAKSRTKSDLMEKIPKLDSDGIPFNKIQIRRMLRRVKHGLDPIATEEEEREIRQREKREKVEEEALYAADQDEEEDGEDGNGEEDQDDATENKEDDNDGEQYDNEQQQQQKEEEEEEPPKKKKKNHNPPSKGTKRAKPVPSNYTCMACNNAPPTDGSDFSQISLFTPHWIYDCPMKKTKKGCNQVAKKLRGLHDPPSQKVFVSGLPFECDEGSVKRFFEDSLQQSGKDSGTSVELVHCKLLKFEDSKRCKGTAFLTFDSDDAAKLALKMNGSVWREVEEPGTKTKSKKKGGKKDEGGEKKELKLRVTKVLNRHVTKQKRGGKK